MNLKIGQSSEQMQNLLDLVDTVKAFINEKLPNNPVDAITVLALATGELAAPNNISWKTVENAVRYSFNQMEREKEFFNKAEFLN